MRAFAVLALIIGALLLSPASAQIPGSTAAQVQIGIMVAPGASGCPSTGPACWLPSNSTNPFPVVGTIDTAPTVVTPTDRGGTIASGGTAQNAMAANTSRKGGWVQNPCNATEDLYVSTTAAAVVTAGAPDDADLAPCGSFSLNQNGLVIQTAVSVNAATTAHAYIAKETQ